MLLISHKGLLIHAYQQPRRATCRIVKEPRATDRNLIHRCNRMGLRCGLSAEKILHQQPELPNGKGNAGQRQKFDKLTPRHILILRPVNWKILPPPWLFRWRTTVRRNSQLFGFLVDHRIKRSLNQ